MRCIVQTPTNKLENSLEFYSKLNFELIGLDDETLLSDGKIIIEINPERYARAGLKICAGSWRKVADQLEEITSVIQTKTGFLLAAPSGCLIYLEECPEKPNYDITGISPSVLGNFASLSLETTDLQKSLDFWLKIGFKITSGTIDHGWISLIGPDGFSMSILKILGCPHLFFNPSLSFFNGSDNLKVIQKIRELEIPITEEITVFNNEGIVDNIIIRDPGGLGFFIFND